MKGTSQIAKIPTRPCRLTGSNPKNLCAVGAPERDYWGKFCCVFVCHHVIKWVMLGKSFAERYFVLIPFWVPFCRLTPTVPCIHTRDHLLQKHKDGRAVAGGRG